MGLFKKPKSRPIKSGLLGQGSDNRLANGEAGPAGGGHGRRRSGSDFPHFHATASDQLDPALSDRLTKLRLNLRASFTPSQPIADRTMFAGRRHVLASLIRAIEDQRYHAVIYGDRGIGKTSLLNVLAQAAREARYLVVYASCGPQSNFNELFRSISASISLLYHRDYGPTSAEAERGETLADILPARDVTVRAAAEFCTRLAGTRVLILLDEFDRSEALTFKRDIAEFLKNLSDRQARCQLVIAGVASDLSEMLAEIPSIRRNIYALSVPRMQADEVRQLINHGEATSQLDFSPEAVEQIVQTANGLPYLASLLCQHMGLAALGQGRQTVVVEDVAAAIEDILADLETQLSARARDHIGELIHSRAHVYLGRLAGHVRMTNAEFDVKAVDAVYSADTSVQVRRLLAELASDGRLLEADEGEFGRHYRFVDSNAPQYLWLLSEQARILGFQEPTELRSTLEAGKANADVKPSSPEPASKAGASRYL